MSVTHSPGGDVSTKRLCIRSRSQSKADVGACA